MFVVFGTTGNLWNACIAIADIYGWTICFPRNDQHCSVWIRVNATVRRQASLPVGYSRKSWMFDDLLHRNFAIGVTNTNRKIFCALIKETIHEIQVNLLDGGFAGLWPGSRNRYHPGHGP
jgi:hypothetical protein